jgi:hypothetical protein
MIRSCARCEGRKVPRSRRDVDNRGRPLEGFAGVFEFAFKVLVSSFLARYGLVNPWNKERVLTPSMSANTNKNIYIPTSSHLLLFRHHPHIPTAPLDRVTRAPQRHQRGGSDLQVPVWSPFHLPFNGLHTRPLLHRLGFRLFPWLTDT